MNKRQIRLKEFSRNIRKIHYPTEAYLAKASQLDPDVAYFQQTCANGFTKSGNFFNGDQHICIVGDSFVENIFVRESKRFTSILERMFLSSGARVSIINAGVSGMTGLNAFNLILNKIVPLRPDRLIFVQPSIDFSSLLYKKGYYNDSKLFSNLCPQDDTDKWVYDTIEENVYQIEQNIKLISYVCGLNDINLTIATCASNSSKRQLCMMNDVIRNNTSLGYDLLDLDKILDKSSHYFYDRQHLNENGSLLMANIMFKYLCKFINLPDIKISLLNEISFKLLDSNELDISSEIKDKVIKESWCTLQCIPKKINKLNANSSINVNINGETIVSLQTSNNKKLEQSFQIPIAQDLNKRLSFDVDLRQFDITGKIFYTI